MPAHAGAKLERPVDMMTAGAAPPAAVIGHIEELGFRVTHVYGLTEVYGPAVVCAWHDEWDALPDDERARLKARQGVRYPVLEGLMVADPQTLEPVPRDGETLGEIFMRGNIVMKGYLKNPDCDRGSLRRRLVPYRRSRGRPPRRLCRDQGPLEGHHHLGRREHLDDRGRGRAVPPSGGLEAAVVARPDPQWGETPCAFVTLKDGATADAADIIAFCREHLAHFKAPRHVVFGPLPKTSTGKIQKFVLREQAKEAG